MSKTISLFALAISFIFVLFSSGFAQESLTITTYYPSPYGSYNQLYVSNNVGIGTTSTTVLLQVGYNHTTSEPLLILGSQSSNYDALGTISTNEFAIQPYTYFHILKGYAYTSGSRKFNTGDYVMTINNADMHLMPFSGSVGIGTTSPTYHFTVNDAGTGTIRFGVQSGSNSLYAYGVLQAAWSDIRLKENVQPQSSILEKIILVNPVTYYWKKEAKMDDVMHYGVIGQELQKIFPTLVYEDQDGYLNVRKDEVQFILIEAVKELKSANDALKARIEALEKKE